MWTPAPLSPQEETREAVERNVVAFKTSVEDLHPIYASWFVAKVKKGTKFDSSIVSKGVDKAHSHLKDLLRLLSVLEPKEPGCCGKKPEVVEVNVDAVKAAATKLKEATKSLPQEVSDRQERGCVGGQSVRGRVRGRRGPSRETSLCHTLPLLPYLPLLP